MATETARPAGTKVHKPGAKVWWAATSADPEAPAPYIEYGTVLDWLTHIEADLVLVMREPDGAVFARSHWELHESHR